MLKGFITADNKYYESFESLNSRDVEVPLRRHSLHAPPVVTPVPRNGTESTTVAKNLTNNREESGMFGNVGWKDIITFIYFLGGIAALWINTSDRILILEQRVQVIEKDIVTMRANVKEIDASHSSHLRNLEKDLSTLRMDMIRAGVAK